MAQGVKDLMCNAFYFVDQQCIGIALSLSPLDCRCCAVVHYYAIVFIRRIQRIAKYLNDQKFTLLAW